MFMKDNKLIGTIGIFIFLFLLFVSIFSSLFFLIYTIPVLIISLYILFNNKEDKIEQIKKR